jgi:hypothetical protein
VSWTESCTPHLSKLASPNPAVIAWASVLVIFITGAVIVTMKVFAKQTPAARRDVI